MRNKKTLLNRSGFTLIEVLVALVILGMILAVSGTILLSTLRTRQSIEEQLTPTITGTSLLQLMIQDLSASIIPESQDQETIYFYGKDKGGGETARDEIDFVTGRNRWSAEEKQIVDYSECGYLLKRNPNAPGLYRLYRRTSPWINGSPVRGGTLTQLHSRVVSMNIMYRNREQDNVKAEWQDNWSNSNEDRNLPDQIRITLVLQDLPSNGKEQNRATKQTFQSVVSLKQYGSPQTEQSSPDDETGR